MATDAEMEMVYIKPASVGGWRLTPAEPLRFSIVLLNLKHKTKQKHKKQNPRLIKEGGLHTCEYRAMKFLKLLATELEGIFFTSVLADK